MWDRRQIIGSSLIAAALGTFGDVVWAQGPSGSAPAASGMAGMMTRRECIDSCLKSHRMCLETARYCTEKAGAHVAPAHLALLLDCAEMCQMTANSLLRSSPQHGVICGACAQLCEACAKDCDTFSGDDQMTSCATTCRDCARDCRAMVNVPL